MSRTLRVFHKAYGSGGYKELALVNPEAASDQIDTMEFTFTKDTKVLDIYARDETYLKLIEQKIFEFIQNDSEFDADTEEEHDFLVRKHIRENQLFAICPYVECIDNINKYFNNMIPASHILQYKALGRRKYFLMQSEGYISEYVRDWSRASYRPDNKAENEFIQATLDPTTFSLGFDVVIGFLPENNNYIDFMYYGCMMCRGRLSVITPTTWMDNGPRAMNSEYREKIRRYIKEVIYFPNSKDIADINVYGGMSMLDLWHLGDFDRPDDGHYRPAKMWTKSYSYKMEHLCTSLTMNTSLNVVRDLNPVLNKLAMKLEKDKSKIIKPVKSDDTDCYRVAVRGTFDNRVFYDENDKLRGVGDAVVLEPGNECLWPYKTLVTCDSIEEAKSLRSYINTTPIQYVLAISAVSNDVTDKRNWRHIPMPENLDHRFTDTEVYKMLGLIPKWQTIIKRTMGEV